MKRIPWKLLLFSLIAAGFAVAAWSPSSRNPLPNITLKNSTPFRDARLIFTPQNATVHVGQTTTVTISVDSNGLAVQDVTVTLSNPYGSAHISNLSPLSDLCSITSQSLALHCVIPENAGMPQILPVAKITISGTISGTDSISVSTDSHIRSSSLPNTDRLRYFPQFTLLTIP